jgi:CRISPR-associated endonuclease/helicase Cas3
LHVTASGTAVGQVDVQDRDLCVDVVDVEAWSGPGLVTAVRNVLEPLEVAGTALVVTNTVADAQRVAADLVVWAERNDVELRCLHSRMRMRDRRRVTDEIVARLGRDASDRPSRMVVVATQVVEQSVDIDADLVVSALAPVAPLLQRAGRGHRHVRDRSALPVELQQWRLVVLRPVDAGELAVPFGWRFVYPVPYVARTAVLLGAGRRIGVPSSVSSVVESVYGEMEEPGEPDVDTVEMLDRQWAERLEAARRMVSGPSEVEELYQLTADLDDGVLATRLGADSATVLVVERGGTAVLLDGRPLPATPDAAELRGLLDATVPLRRTRALVDMGSAGCTPAGWERHPLLRDVLVVEADGDGTVAVGDRRFRIDELLGWVDA